MSAVLSGEVRAFLEAPRMATVATINRDGSPQQTVVWYDLQDGVLVMNTRRGRLKDRNLRRDPRLSFVVEDGQQYVTIKGQVKLIDDQEIAQRDIRALAVRYDGEEAAEAQVQRQYAHETRVTILLSIETIYLYGF